MDISISSAKAGANNHQRKETTFSLLTLFTEAYSVALTKTVEEAKEAYKRIPDQYPENDEARCYVDLLNRRSDVEMTPFYLSAYILANNPDHAEMPRSHLNSLRKETAKVDELCVKAGHNDPDANFTLGIMYLEGAGVDADDTLAAAYLQQSGDRGQSKLQEMYLQGRCITDDNRDAAEQYLDSLLRNSHDINPADIYFGLAEVLKDKQPEIFRLYSLQAEELGHPRAMSKYYDKYESKLTAWLDESDLLRKGDIAGLLKEYSAGLGTTFRPGSSASRCKFDFMFTVGNSLFNGRAGNGGNPDYENALKCYQMAQSIIVESITEERWDTIFDDHRRAEEATGRAEHQILLAKKQAVVNAQIQVLLTQLKQNPKDTKVMMALAHGYDQLIEHGSGNMSERSSAYLEEMRQNRADYLIMAVQHGNETAGDRLTWDWLQMQEKKYGLLEAATKPGNNYTAAMTYMEMMAKRGKDVQRVERSLVAAANAGNYLAMKTCLSIAEKNYQLPNQEEVTLAQYRNNVDAMEQSWVTAAKAGSYEAMTKCLELEKLGFNNIPNLDKATLAQFREKVAAIQAASNS